MMGRSHAVTGVCAGVVSAPFAAHFGCPPVVWVAAVSAASILPDVDHPSATVAGMWGPPSRVLAVVVNRSTGGHRGLTHEPVRAVVVGAVVGAAVWLGWGAVVAEWPPLASVPGVARAALFGFLFGVAVAAVGAVFDTRPRPALNLAASTLFAAAAWWNVWPLTPVLAPLALGWVVHVAGDRVRCNSATERLVVVVSVAAAVASLTRSLWWPLLAAALH